MTKPPPHILVTTPESLYILLTSEGGRGMLRTVATVIVDEIHAVARDKRGSHLALSLERLEALVGRPGPADRPLGDAEAARGSRPVPGRRRAASARSSTRGTSASSTWRIEVPPSPLATVCSHEQWEEIYERMADAHPRAPDHARVRQHAQDGRADRGAPRPSASARSRSRATTAASRAARRLDAEQRLKAGKLRALVATASLELGHRHRRRRPRRSRSARRARSRRSCSASAARATRCDASRRAGSSRSRSTSWSRAAALLDVRPRRASSTARRSPPRPLDILAQQIVAACVAEAWNEDELFERLPPRLALPRPERARTSTRSSRSTPRGRRALLHRDGVGRRAAWRRSARGSRRSPRAARSPTPPTTRCSSSPRAPSSARSTRTSRSSRTRGDIFQLGNASWRILQVEPGVVRVADAQGAPPTIPFWLGEAPARTRELSAAIGELREERARRRRRPPSIRRSAATRCRAGGAASSPTTSRRAGARSAPCPTPAARGPRALLRRERRHAARRARAVRRPDQPRVGARAAQALLPWVRLRAAGRGQRGGDRALARAAAQLPARGRVRLPAPDTARDVLVQALLARAACSRRAGAGTRRARCC